MGCSPWGRKESDTTERLHFLSFFLEKEMATHSKILAWTSLGQNSLSGYIGHRLAKSRTQLSD